MCSIGIELACKSLINDKPLFNELTLMTPNSPLSGPDPGFWFRFHRNDISISASKFCRISFIYTLFSLDIDENV